MHDMSRLAVADAHGVLFEIIDSAVDAIISIDADQRIILVNQAALRTFGYDASQVMGQPLSMLIPERSRAMRRRHVSPLVETGASGMSGVSGSAMGALGVIHGVRANGEEFPIEASISSVRQGGARIRTVILRDASGRVDDERKIGMLTRTYSALSQTSHMLLECTHEQELFDQVCRIAVESGGMKLAWIGKLDGADGLIRPVASWGEGRSCLAGLEISVREDSPAGREPAATACREGRAMLSEDFLADPRTAPFHKQGRAYGWGASATFPILLNGRTHAALTMYHARVNPFTPAIISLMKEMAANVAHGLSRFALEAEKHKAEESSRLAALIYRSSAEAVMVTDENNLIIDVNPAFTALTGYTLDDVRGKDPRILRSGRHDRAFYEEMWRGILEHDHWQGELCDRRKDGSLHVKLATISVIRDEAGRIYRHVAQFFDITERKQKEELIWKQANYDTLTGLPNRRLFLDRLEQEIKKANRSGLPLALLFIDLDRFKEVNDTLGHAKGDELLIEAARRIAGQIRETDTVARLGGDEFMIILTELGERAQLERIAQGIIHALAKPFDLGGGNTVYVSASIGIALYPDDANEVDALFKDADQAMYSAKTQGRNRFNYFTRSMQQAAHEKLALTNDLRHALARNELEVYYQPIVSPAQGRITKAEALLRWKHPARGMVSPDVFIPLAEESGLIVDIGEWVFEQAIASIRRWQRAFGRIIQLSVNKSPVQFENAIQHRWMEKLAASGLPTGSINVEITERLLIKDSGDVKLRLTEFRNHGVEVSVDDFGTGFSALSYLEQFDVDYLKIDRSFVSHLADNGSNRALTESIIQMAHKLGVKAIAEGVETEAQRDLLTEFGCDFLQGYLYSRPLPADAFERLLRDPEFGAASAAPPACLNVAAAGAQAAADAAGAG